MTAPDADVPAFVDEDCAEDDAAERECEEIDAIDKDLSACFQLWSHERTLLCLGVHAVRNDLHSELGREAHDGTKQRSCGRVTCC